MKKKLSYIFATGLMIFASCSSDQNGEKISSPTIMAYEDIKKTDWLLGSWQGHSPEGVFGESWQRKDDSTFTGTGYFVVGKDTVSKESLRLTQKGNDLFYEPTVREQNNGQTVRFKMTGRTDSTMVFENPEHDFPQMISYGRITADSVVARISGKMEGKESEQVFPMKRIR